MNERLKELMLEAGYAAPELAERAQKLSELIVNDCVSQISQHFVGAVGTYAGCHNSAVKKCKDSVVERFGDK